MGKFLHIRAVAALALSLLMASCFTGVEGSKKITEKDVQKAYSKTASSGLADSIQAYRDSLPAWKPGKTFTAADDQVRLIFAPSDSYDVSKLALGGKRLTYTGYSATTLLDNRRILNINFSDGRHTLVYPSGKTLADFTSKTAIPFLIDNDFVASVDRLMRNRIMYVRTSIWYDLATEGMVAGRKFIAVRIDSVCPGNKVLPLKVAFTTVDNGKSAFVWMSGGDTHIRNRNFDSMFSLDDIHKSYPNIGPEAWDCIVNGRVALDMTKEECLLAKGAPKSINRVPDQTGVREYWYYDGGSYLYFTDGVLKGFR